MAPQIRETAHGIAGDAASKKDKIHSLVQWIQDNIEKNPVDAFTALDVLARRKAECQGHAYFYAALARSLGIPTRVVNGIVYSEDHGGFLYHTWAESLIESTWIPVDPTFAQIPADATHIKLVEGETLQDLVPLASLIGRIRIKILAADE
jgi:transglutaminase-like putative cysteine protease